MEFSRGFFRGMAICAAVAAVCVLVAQFALSGYPRPSNAVEALALYRHPVFRAQGWLILVQVFLMFLALWGVTVKSLRLDPGLVATGAILFLFWQVFELIPRSIEMYTVAGIWAPRHAAAVEEATRGTLETYFAAFANIAAGIGSVRRLLWAAGHLLFGLALWRGVGLQRAVSAFFLLNFLRLFPRVLGEAAGWEWLAELVRGRIPFVLGMMPLLLLIAIWLWRDPRMEDPAEATRLPRGS